MMLENAKYRFWYHYYKIANKLGLWRLYFGVDERTGIPYTEAKWIWQEKPQDVVTFEEMNLDRD